MMPEYLKRTIKDHNAKTVLTVHHSKYELARHHYDEPLNNISKVISESACENFTKVLSPTIGEPVSLFMQQKDLTMSERRSAE